MGGAERGTIKMKGLRAIFLIFFVVFAGIFCQGLLDIHPFGEPRNSSMDDYFIANAQSECAANNVVTSIVFDYRGFDTLGEAAVLLTAVMSVAALFRKEE